MEIFKISGREKRAGNKCLLASLKTINDLNHKAAKRRQVRIINFVFVLIPSLYLSLKLHKVCGVSVNANVLPKPQTFAKAALGAKKGTKEFAQNGKNEKIINSYMKKENDKLKYLQKCQKLDSPEEILSGGYSENNVQIYGDEIYQSLTSLNSKRENSPELQRRRYMTRVYNDGKDSPNRMIDIIQRELKTITDMSPSVISLTTALSETLSHYKECSGCSEKISSALPQILHRIQKLVEYISTKRLCTYLRINASGCFRLELGDSIFKSEKRKNSASREPKSDFLTQKLGKQIESSEKVNAIDIAEGRLGIQFALQIKHEINSRRLFEQRFLKNFGESFSIVYLKESVSVSVIEIKKPSPKPQVLWDIRNIILLPKELFHAYHQVFALPSKIPISVLVINPVFRIHRIEKTQRTLYFKSDEPCEEQILRTKKNPFRVFILQNKKTSEPKAVWSRNSKTRHSNEKKRFAKRELIANFPEIIRDLLKESEEKKMQIHKMKELELEIKQLKDLIVEVHKNQVELGKVVVEEGIYSQLIMKLTDPNMLEEENQIVKRLAVVEEFGKKNYIENLQATVDYIKQKCTLKNRMIMTLIKCLHSNLYKKWWEEIINSTFDESKPTEKLSNEKVTKLLQQSSFFLLKSKKESKESLEEPRAEEQNSEEEVLDTEFETLSQSDFDLESNYMTGLEDLPGNEPNKPKEKLTSKKVLPCEDEFCTTSSFIQNVLCEDSQTGIAIVDLFVAVKLVKDDLNILSRCNNQLFYKINYLNKETRIIRAEYRNLLKMMLEFSDKINADTFIWNFSTLKRIPTGPYTSEDYSKTNKAEYLTSIEEGLRQKEMETSQREQTSEHEREESEIEFQKFLSKEISRSTSGKNLNRRYENQCRKCKKNESEEFESKHKCPMYVKNIKDMEADVNCLGCFMSAFKEIPFHQLPILPEALLGSFLASFLWLLKENKKTLNSSKSSSPDTLNSRKEKESDESLGNTNFSELTIQMICDVWGILSEATFQELESKDLPHPLLKKAKKSEKDVDLKSRLSCGNRFRRPPSAKVTASSERIDLTRSFVKENLTLCNGTISSPDCLNYERNTAKSNKSSKAAVEAKEKSSSEDESDFMEALTGPLTPLSRTELKAPRVTCMGDLTKAVIGKKSASTLTATNNAMTSWVGRPSDETQYEIKKIKSKTNLRLNERSFEKPSETSKEVQTKYSGSAQFTVTTNTSDGFYDVTVVQFKKNRLSDRIMSEDSFHTSDSEVSGANSNTAENEFEEFIEIYLGDSKNKSEKVIPEQEKGILKKMELKTHKAHFFEIQKCHSMCFVQEIIRKTSAIFVLDIKKFRNATDENEISSGTEEKQKKQVVFEKSSSDVVIYIQVEVEESWDSKISKLCTDNQKNSLGTQTAENSSEIFFTEGIIKLDESKEDGESLFHVWKGCDVSHSEETKQKEGIHFDEPLMISGESKVEMKEEQLKKVNAHNEKVLKVQKLEEKTVNSNEKVPEMYFKSEIKETYLEEEKGGRKKGNEEKEEEEEEEKKITITGIADLLIMKEEKQRTDAWFFLHDLMHKLNIVVLEQAPEVSPEVIEMININAMELAKALNLIHEIENDIIHVKLNDAISILPQLESELRKHLQSKLRNIGERESENEISVDKFFSTVNFWPEEESTETKDDNSQERMNNLLSLLSNLEKAVRFNERSSNKLETCQFGFTKIYELLQALTGHIRKLEDHPNITSLSQTLDIASELDTAVREYDSIMNKQPLNYVSPKKKSRRKSKSLEEIPVEYHLKNVRKKVFEIVEEEATNLEGMMETEFDRLHQIERENNEAMTFLEAFLQKTERRMAELSNLKSELKNLSSSLQTMYETYRETITRRREREMAMEKLILQKKESEERSVHYKYSNEINPAAKQEFASDMISGLLSALDSLKSRAREKNEVCKEILFTTGFERAQESEDLSRRSSRTSFSDKHLDNLSSSVKECKKIGNSSLYLSWTEPEGPFKDHIVGYQIYVDGKLNQKVRNPQRLQAVLYSVDFTKKIQVQLYALSENHLKTLIGTWIYPDE